MLVLADKYKNVTAYIKMLRCRNYVEILIPYENAVRFPNYAVRQHTEWSA